jgi:hypothetical protein
MRVRRSAAHDDGTWIDLCGPGSTEALQAITTAVDPGLTAVVTGNDADWTMTLAPAEHPHTESGEVAVTKFSGGSDFVFQPRRSLPLTVV